MPYKVERRSWSIGGNESPYLAEEICVTHPDGTVVCMYESGTLEAAVRVNGKCVLEGLLYTNEERKVFRKRFKRESGISVKDAHMLYESNCEEEPVVAEKSAYLM